MLRSKVDKAISPQSFRAEHYRIRGERQDFCVVFDSKQFYWQFSHC